MIPSSRFPLKRCYVTEIKNLNTHTHALNDGQEILM